MRDERSGLLGRWDATYLAMGRTVQRRRGRFWLQVFSVPSFLWDDDRVGGHERVDELGLRRS